jgi:hypothetical protein
VSTPTTASNTAATSSAAAQAELTKKAEQARSNSKAINLATWGVAGGVMIYGTVNVTMLLIQHHVPVLIAPLLSLMVDLGLVVALVAAPVLADYRRKSGWVNLLRWVTALMSWGLNIAEPALDRDWVGVGIHSCGPVLLIVVAEAGAALQRTLAGIVGELDDKLAAASQAAPKTQRALADLRAEIADARRELAETQARAESEAERAESETRARTEAETASGKQAEILRQAQAEIGRLKTAVREAVDARDVARRHASEQIRAAGVAEGRLAEARGTADRAARAAAATEQHATDHMRQVSVAAEKAERTLREQLAAATRVADETQSKVAELTEQVRVVQAQREEARAATERQSTGRVIAEQKVGELQRSRDAAFNEIERLRRQLPRAAEKAEMGSGRQPEISRAPGRKRLASVPAALPDGLPEVETVKPETVAIVLAARAELPGATQAQISAATGISDRTIRKVLNAVPASRILALTDGRVA